jgi:hypothetical protein
MQKRTLRNEAVRTNPAGDQLVSTARGAINGTHGSNGPGGCCPRGTFLLPLRPEAQSSVAWPQRLQRPQRGQYLAEWPQSLHLLHHSVPPRPARNGRPSTEWYSLFGEVATMGGVTVVGPRGQAPVLKCSKE